MKRIVGITLVAIMMAGTSAMACEQCGCKAKKTEVKKECKCTAKKKCWSCMSCKEKAAAKKAKKSCSSSCSKSKPK